MIRLVGDVAACGGGATEKRRVLMDGLARLVDAERWLWSMSSKAKTKIKPGQRPLYTPIAHGGFEDGLFPKLLKAVDHPDSWEIFSGIGREIRQGNLHVTRTRRQIDLTDRFSREDVRVLWREAGVGDILVSVRPMSSGDFSAIGIYRGNDTPEFNGREAQIAHIVLAEVPWLHETGWSEQDQLKLLPKLSPRRRAVLNLVLEGHPRKEMASMLGISSHTLDGYVKDIFRHFGVHSQAELIARFRSGSPETTPDIGD
jgi:DNA-binding CsgD family transcriptional regulator